MPLYGAIDLHSNNNYVVVIDDQEQIVFRRREPNHLETVVRDLEPFRSELVGVAVESTYNWYWLVDGLAQQGYTMHLVNTAAVQQYEGLKYSNDWSDTLWLARLLRLGVLPEGYIYPRKQRPLRDLLRKRSQLVRHRTAQLLSLGNIMTRHTGNRVSRSELKQLTLEQVNQQLSQPLVALSVDCSLQVAQTLDKQIDRIEQEVQKQLKLDKAAHKTLQLLETVWGVGPVLGRAILLETGPVSRFASVGDYSSYCRAVASQCWSNGRKKGENNAKCGNRYLAWAFVEAANYAALSYRQARVFVERKTAQTNRALAVKALANKLCRASYWVMKEQVKFEPARLFGS
jgi:transposase